LTASRVGPEKVTLDEAFEKVGGCGKFQYFSMIMNAFGNGGASFFLFAFAFLEAEPVFKCKMSTKSDDWTTEIINPLEEEEDVLEWITSSETNPLEEEFCSGSHECVVDMDAPDSLYNLMAQTNFYCAPKWEIGLIGFCFLIGIVIGCVTVTRMGDTKGRKPIY
jgi:hypothetical protein